MIRRLWDFLIRPWRHDTAFADRMHQARCAALEQSRISLREQRRLRMNPVESVYLQAERQSRKEASEHG